MNEDDVMPDVIRDFVRVSPAIIAEAARFPSSILADVAGRLVDYAAELRRLLLR